MKKIILLLAVITSFVCPGLTQAKVEFQHHIMAEEYIDFAFYKEHWSDKEPGFVHDMCLLYRFVARGDDNIALIASPLILFNTHEIKGGFKVGVDYQFK